ncbi:MAG TPA: cache domain-containing protein, partial [Negativicutes bacterium]
MKSIQTKLIISILAIFLVALSTLGGLNYWKARDILNGTLTMEIAKEAESSAGDVGDWLEARKMEITMLAKTPVIMGGNRETIMPVIVAAAQASKIYYNIAYIDLSGNLTASTGSRVNVSDRSYFQQALKGEASISDPFVTRDSGHLVVTVVVPVLVDGKVSGALSGTVRIASLAEKVMAVKVGQTGYAFVVQQDGLQIIHPSNEIAMKFNPLKDAGADPVQKQVVEHMVKGEKGIVILPVQQANQYHAYAPVPGTAWSLGITVPVNEVTGAVSALTTVSTLTIVVILAITAIIITWYARRIARPIQVLEAAAKRIAGGDITLHKLGIDSDDEIGR